MKIARRAVLAALAGLAAVLAGFSHQGSFVGQLVHGWPGALETSRRKVLANLGSLTQYWYGPLVPAVALATGLMLAFPGRPRLGWLGRLALVGRRPPLAMSTLRAVWLALTLIWLPTTPGSAPARSGSPSRYRWLSCSCS